MLSFHSDIMPLPLPLADTEICVGDDYPWWL
jgi:hypothetical protein